MGPRSTSRTDAADLAPPASAASPAEAPITALKVHACAIPTDSRESDGTFAWAQTTIVIVEIEAAGARGLGYTYASAAAAALVHETLADVLEGRDAMDVPGAFVAMARAVRNIGRAGIAQSAISAIDAALWDLKALILDVPLAVLLGRARDAVEVYGSGGFTSYTIEELQRQLADWIGAGFTRVKMKVGREPASDPARVAAAREAIGPRAQLFVDANGAYSRKQALALADAFAKWNVAWFEEAISSDDLDGLRLLRDRAPAGMAIAAGERKRKNSGRDS